jgi:RIO kinase 2
LDYLALHTHVKADAVFSVGHRIGVGKEADIVIVASPPPAAQQCVLKIHRLGRISFRSVKTNRDYLRKRAAGSWMYMSKLAAMREYAVLKALYDTGFPVPLPIACNRHTLVMSLVDGTPLRSISSVPDPAQLYAQLIELILRLAKFGLIHGDFNEFNILIEEIPSRTESSSSTSPPSESSPSSPITLRPVIIDFPQSLSTSHTNAAAYFDRDVSCIKRFFERRFGFTSDEPGPFFTDAMKNPSSRRLDVEVEASGFNRKMAAELLRYIEDVGANEGVNEGEEGGESEDGEIEHEEEGRIEMGEEDGGDLHEPEDGEDNDSANLHNYRESHSSQLDSAMAKLDMNSQLDDSVSVAGTVRSRRTVNPAKASKGWAI